MSVIQEIVDDFLMTPLAFIQAKIRREFGLLPSECHHPKEMWRFDRMICGKCGLSRQDILLQRGGATVISINRGRDAKPCG